jgi:cell division protease FtsH
MIFLGREMTDQRDYSEAIAKEIDREVKAIVDQAYATARTALSEHIDKLKLVAERLIEVETLTAEEFIALWESDGQPAPAPAPISSPVAPKAPERRWEDVRGSSPQTSGPPPSAAPSPA